MIIRFPNLKASAFLGALLWALTCGGLPALHAQYEILSLKRDLTDLWDGSWIRQHLRANQKHSVQLAGLSAALDIHRREFSARAAMEREWQLAEIRASLRKPDPSLQSDFPTLLPDIKRLSETIVADYTSLHEDLFGRDTDWERLRSQVFIDFEGESLRSGELLARAINYLLELKPDATPGEFERELFTVIDRRIQDYLFAFNNGTAANRRLIHTVWQQNAVDMLPPKAWQLSENASEIYHKQSERFLATVQGFKRDLEYAFDHPKFTTRRGISPAVAEILQILSDNYFEFETYSRWFSQNEALMTEALVTVDMRTRATPHKVVKLDPVTLKPTDLDEALEQTGFVDTIAGKRRQLLLKYLAIREEVNAEIEEEIVKRKKLLKPEEEEILWREYQKMKDLTRANPAAK